MVSVQQRDRRMLKSQGGDGKNLTIGFHVMKVCMYMCIVDSL